jgi:ribosome-binding factor A
MEYKRADRVSLAVKREVAEMLIREIKDPRIGMVTVTGVTMSPDLRHARIYYSVLGGEKELKDSAAGLKQATPYIQRQIGHRIRLRFTPELDFQYDHSLEYGSHIEQLLKSIVPSDRTPSDEES